MPVLRTKLHLPVPRRRLVPRGRLVDRLDADTPPRLVLVAAPAGFGKTTLLTQWLERWVGEAGEADRRVAWLALDPVDADVRRFLTLVIAAVRTAAPEAGVEAAALLEGTATPDPRTVVSSLVNDLDLLSGRTVLALDDYHVLDDRSVHDVVGFLLDHLPPQVTLAMTTRADPPLALPRLRARGEMVEIRAGDLRFTPEEADRFLNGVMDLSLPPALVDALESRTEGWAAGLQLAALSAAARADGDVAAFVEAFSGSHRFVLDYLVEEVLDRQPPSVRQFLLATSVLDQLCGDLCDAVTGGADGADQLHALERANVFLVPLEEERRWYRYHHLFAEVLRARLSTQQPERVGGLHAAASRWYAGEGMVPDAMRHALAGGDHERTADLFELDVPRLRRARDVRALEEWLVALPEEVVRRRPLLAVQMAWLHLSAGDVAGVPGWLDAVQSGLRGAPAPLAAPAALADAARDREAELGSLPAVVAMYRASVAQAAGDVEDTIARGREAIDLAGPDDHFPRAAGAAFVGMAAWAEGDLEAGVEAFTETATGLAAAGMVADELGTTVMLASLWLGLGRPDEARRLYERAVTRADSHPGPVLSTTGDLHVGLADVLREQGHLDEAAHHLEVARSLGDAALLPEHRHRWFTAMAGLLRTRGDLDAAVRMLDEAEPLFRPGFYPDVRPIAATRAQLWLLLGRHEEAEGWARARGVTADDPPEFLAEHDQLTLARLLVAGSRARDALPLLDRVVGAAEAAGRGGSVVEAYTVRALAHDAAGSAGPALDDLAAALATGVPVGYRRLILDEGGSMIRLLERLAAAGDPHAPLLLDARPGPAARATAARGGPEGLSDRELEVLRLLATELSGPEIAGRLFVSVNTLRTHTKHIFTKLDVNNRRAAVRRGGELGLL
ncbi:LuxR C-terminal-related transcriptional regulator [Nocardioides sp. YIM 152588]|uniref:LuxR C-terminal-related transcriptional regulator n=1 Tax=Nocardioides sp. YIM 152588 TaxID=3158259 RepID=UPI0032E3883A